MPPVDAIDAASEGDNMDKFNDPFEKSFKAFTAGVKDEFTSGGGPRVLRPWAKVVLWFVFGVAATSGLLVLYGYMAGR